MHSDARSDLLKLERSEISLSSALLAPVPLVDADVVGPLFDGDDVVYLVADPHQVVGRDVQPRRYRVDEHDDRQVTASAIWAMCPYAISGLS